jgi:hypothetical protein
VRKVSLIIILATLLFLTVAGPQLANQAKANPYRYYPHVTEISPPTGTQAPIINIHTPQNGSSYPRNSIPLTFDVIIPQTNGNKSLDSIQELYYITSWEPNKVEMIDSAFEGNASYSINLYSALGGNLSVTVYAVGRGEYETRPPVLTDGFVMNHYYNNFRMNSSSTVSFTQDFVPPKIAVLSPQKSSYGTSDIDLSLTSNEALSQILYCLDGNQNQTITGNVTLTGLTNGAHNVTIYAADLAGYMVASETTGFTVTEGSEPFPTVPFIAVLGIVLTAIVVLGSLLLYRRHRKPV